MLEQELFYKRLLIHLDNLVSNKNIEYKLIERVSDIPSSFIPNASGYWTSTSSSCSIPVANRAIKKVIKEFEITNKDFLINIRIDPTQKEYIHIYFRDPKIPVSLTGTSIVLTSRLFINKGDCFLEDRENFDQNFIDLVIKFLEEIRFLGNNAVSFIVS